MSKRPPFPGSALSEAGLNRQFVFDLAALPADIRATLGDTSGFRQLILLGHGGRLLWEKVQANRPAGEDPIDDYCVQTLGTWCATHLPTSPHRIVYPGSVAVGLQALGQLAGWHHPSPFMVGVDPDWGSWYAYRAVLLADSDFLPFFPVDRESPCLGCSSHPCLDACPPDALSGPQFDLHRCTGFRLQPASPCAEGCLARLACPVGSEHRYDIAQIRHSYSHSLAMLRQWMGVNR